jgi:hypothetical protein
METTKLGMNYITALRKKYEALKDLVSYFKSNGALIVNNDFKVVASTLNKKDADEFSRIYPKLYLKRVIKDFPAYFDKHSADYDLTPEEFIFIDSINYINKGRLDSLEQLLLSY